jgi:hypothetical protein
VWWSLLTGCGPVVKKNYASDWVVHAFTIQLTRDLDSNYWYESQWLGQRESEAILALASLAKGKCPTQTRLQMDPPDYLNRCIQPSEVCFELTFYCIIE